MGIILRGMANVLRNPVRLILVVVLLGTSLMFVAAMFSLNSSAQQEIIRVHTQVGTSITINYAENNVVQANGSASIASGSGSSQNPTPVFTLKKTSIPDTAVTTISKTTGIVQTEGMVTQADTDGKLVAGSLTLTNGNKISFPPTVYGISNGATHYKIGSGTTPKLVSGSNFLTKGSDSYVAMMSQTLAKANKLKVGSTFTIKGKTFTLVALYSTNTASDANQIADSTIIIPLSVAEKLYGLKGVDSITAYAATYDQVSTAAAALKARLGSKYDVVTSADTYKSTFDALNVAQNSIFLALIVAIVVAIVVIIFAVFIVVRERTTEIGILKAIGASHWQVIRQFWGEVLAMSGLGAIIAIGLLAIFGPIISQKFNVNSNTQTSQLATGSLVTGTASIGSSISAIPAGSFVSSASKQLSAIHIASATLNLETVLIIVGAGIALAVLTSIIPAWYVAHIKPAVVLRKSNA